MTPAKYEEYASRCNLRKFEDAHNNIYTSALKEIQSGRKQSHWMWYIFPQLRGLGHSRNSDYYGIADRDEAMMFPTSSGPWQKPLGNHNGNAGY